MDTLLFRLSHLDLKYNWIDFCVWWGQNSLSNCPSIMEKPFFVIIQVTVNAWVYSCILCSVPWFCLFSCQYHSVLIIVALQWILRSTFVLQCCLGILGLFHFHLNFRISFLNCMRNTFWGLGWDWLPQGQLLNQQIKFGEN